ncbi:hypothetical protein ACJIZ3_004016 [Penstemon smallii]|uniref:Cytochrome P450 n=1 Tax=Penstemon smallii TaxID=265156 RepID=A0ABD3S120_9LAMI
MAQFFETEGTLFLLLALIFPILFIFINHLKTYFVSNSPPLPPGPTPWPVLGNIPQMVSSMPPHITLTNFAKTYGPLISLKLGTQRLVVASSPDAAREILKTNDRILSGRYVPQSMPYTKSELNQSSLGWTEECNDNWKHLRIICKTGLFSNKAMDSQAILREKHISTLVNFLRGKEGEVMKISELVFTTVFNILGNALMSRDFIGLEEKNEDGGLKCVIWEAMKVGAAPNLADFYPILSTLDLQGLRQKTSGFAQRMHAVWRPTIEERRTRMGDFCSHNDFLDTLLGKDFTNKQINQLFTELFSAGTDTTTATIEWTMAEIMKNQECMEKVRAEIESEIKEDFPKNVHLMELPYLQACIKEALRLHPPAPFLLPHRAIETCRVMNYTVPKNARVLVNIWAIGRDPSTWEEPFKFKPERFLNSNIDYKGNDFEFLPFSAGRRICPGLPMAAKSVPVILVSLIHFFDWSIPDGIDPRELNLKEKFGITMQMEHPLSLIFKARNDYKSCAK